MKISLMQPDIVWADPEANRAKLEEVMWGLDRSDLYVLPENIVRIVIVVNETLSVFNQIFKLIYRFFYRHFLLSHFLVDFKNSSAVAPEMYLL